MKIFEYATEEQLKAAASLSNKTAAVVSDGYHSYFSNFADHKRTELHIYVKISRNQV